MNAVGAGAVFFLFVMGAVVAAGYLLLIRKAEAAGALGVEPGHVLESMGEWVTGPREPSESLRRRLARAGYTGVSAVHFFNGIKATSAVFCFLLVAAALSIIQGPEASIFAPGLCAAAAGYFLPVRLLTYLARERKFRLQHGLPAMLDFCVLSLDAGQTLDQAIQETARGLARSYPELSAELDQVYRETRAANNRTAALRSFAERTGEPEVRKVAALLIDSDRFGTSITAAMRNHAKYLRTRQRQEAQQKARKISVKLIFPVFFLIFPAVILVTLGPACIMVFTQLKELLK
jgi:tight adherence protein C